MLFFHRHAPAHRRRCTVRYRARFTPLGGRSAQQVPQQAGGQGKFASARAAVPAPSLACCQGCSEVPSPTVPLAPSPPPLCQASTKASGKASSTSSRRGSLDQRPSAAAGARTAHPDYSQYLRNDIELPAFPSMASVGAGDNREDFSKPYHAHCKEVRRAGPSHATTEWRGGADGVLFF